MAEARLCVLTLWLACVAPAAAALDWRDRLQAAVESAQQPSEPLTLLMTELNDKHPCNETINCCAEGRICDCINDTCYCHDTAYWEKAANACVKKGELGQNCSMYEQDSCLPEHSSCQWVKNHGYLCECEYPYYPDSGGHSCIPRSSPFFTTTIIVSICILFAAVAIGVVMQIRANMQRRLYRRQYRRHADLDAMLAAQRRARQRRAAQRRANPTRRYSDEAAPDEPPPPYVPIFTTRSSGDWGKLPSYQEAVDSAPERDNEAFEMQENVTGTEEALPAGPLLHTVETGTPSAGAEQESRRTEAPAEETGAATAGTESPPARTVSPADRCQPVVIGVRAPAIAGGLSGPTVPTEEATSSHYLPPLAGRELGQESPLRRTGSI